MCSLLTKVSLKSHELQQPRCWPSRRRNFRKARVQELPKSQGASACSSRISEKITRSVASSSGTVVIVVALTAQFGGRSRHQGCATMHNVWRHYNLFYTTAQVLVLDPERHHSQQLHHSSRKCVAEQAHQQTRGHDIDMNISSNALRAALPTGKGASRHTIHKSNLKNVWQSGACGKDRPSRGRSCQSCNAAVRATGQSMKRLEQHMGNQRTLSARAV